MIYDKPALLLLLVKLTVVNAVTLYVSEKVPFSKGFGVFYDMFGASKSKPGDWIGIHYAFEVFTPPYAPHGRGNVQMWQSVCGTQQYCGSSPPRKKGNVRFDGVDPSTEATLFDSDNPQQWPLRPGNYQVCYWRKQWKNSDFESPVVCKRFKVFLSKGKMKKIKKKATITTKENYAYGEEIVANFNAVYPFGNTIIGIYKANPFGNRNYKQLWLYTGCNNVLGDQKYTYDMSNDCIQKRKSGVVKFTSENTGRASQDFPLCPGTYYMKIDYYNNMHNINENGKYIEVLPHNEEMGKFTVENYPNSKKKYCKQGGPDSTRKRMAKGLPPTAAPNVGP